MSRKFEWLEVMRGLAALWVVLHHTDLSVSHFFPSQDERHSFLSNGFMGVDFFFLLSGFIIAYSSNKLAESGKGISEYAKLRMIRIYIPYLPVGLALYAAYLMFPGLSEADRLPGVLTSFFLLPSESPAALSVAWTLVHEIIFYIFFSIFFISRKLLFAFLAIWVGMIVALFAGDMVVSKTATYFLSPVNLNFILGVGMYYLLRRGVPNWLALASAIVGIILVASASSGQAPVRWLATCGFVGLIVASVSNFFVRFKPMPGLLMLGAASYSVYLIHNPALSVLARALRWIFPSAGAGSAYVILALTSLACGLLYYFIYERSALKAVRNLIDGKYGRKAANACDELCNSPEEIVSSKPIKDLS